MLTVFLAGSFLIGLAVGSFLNVVILRLGEESIKGKSHCPSCGKILSWRELIPVISFFLLKGRCSACQNKISWQYPIVESLSGLIFLLISARFLFWSPTGIDSAFFASANGWWIWPYIFSWWYFAATLLAIAVYDIRHYTIPDILILPAVITAFFLRVFEGILLRLDLPLFPLQGMEFLGSSSILLGKSSGSFLFALLGVFAAVLLLGGIYFFSQGRAMGFGDVKLGIFLGLALGWPAVLLALFLSFLSGTLLSGVLILLSKKSLKSLIPFAPLLAFGTYATMLFGDKIVNVYFNLFPHLFL